MSNAPIKAIANRERNNIFMGGDFDFALLQKQPLDWIVLDLTVERNLFRADHRISLSIIP